MLLCLLPCVAFKTDRERDISVSGMNSGGRKDLGLIHPKKRPGFKEVVQQVWREKKQNRQTWNVVKQKIDQSSMVCRQWSRDNVEPTESLINQKTKSLVKLQGLGDGADIEAINSLQDEVNELIELEDVRWRQKFQIFSCLSESTPEM